MNIYVFVLDMTIKTDYMFYTCLYIYKNIPASSAILVDSSGLSGVYTTAALFLFGTQIILWSSAKKMPFSSI